MIYFKAIVLEQTLSLFDWLEIASGLAALLAGAGCGVFADIEGARDATIAVTDRTRPDAQRVQTYERIYQVYRDLYPAVSPTMHALDGLV